MHQKLNELNAAIAAERAAWAKVKDKLPGTPHFEQDDWSAWLQSVERCRAARQALDEGEPRSAG